MPRWPVHRAPGGVAPGPEFRAGPAPAWDDRAPMVHGIDCDFGRAAVQLRARAPLAIHETAVTVRLADVLAIAAAYLAQCAQAGGLLPYNPVADAKPAPGAPNAPRKD